MSTPGFKSERWRHYLATILSESGNSWEIDFLKSSFMNSDDVKYCAWLFLMPKQFPMHVLVHFPDHWFLMFFKWFLVFSCDESASHPLSLCKRECPKLSLVTFDVSAGLPTRLVHFQEHCCFMISNGFLMLSCEESASTPSLAARGFAPSLQMMDLIVDSV